MKQFTLIKVADIICDCCGINRGCYSSSISTKIRGEGEYNFCPNDCFDQFKTLEKSERLILREFIKLLHEENKIDDLEEENEKLRESLCEISVMSGYNPRTVKNYRAIRHDIRQVINRIRPFLNE